MPRWKHDIHKNFCIQLLVKLSKKGVSELGLSEQSSSRNVNLSGPGAGSSSGE